MTWHPAHLETPPVEDADSALARTETWWQDWTSRSQYEGAYRDEVQRSLIVLKAMTYETTGALIAAPTTSLPEDIGGLRNWDYRYCWLRDSVLALQALIAAGYGDEAMAFRDFLLHTATGDPSKLQIMYAIAGERRLTEFELPELPGYEGVSSESVTPHPNSSSWMSTARSSTWLTSASSCAAGSSPGCGRDGVPPSSTSRRSGASRTTGSGRAVVLAAITPTPRSWPGWCSTAPCGWPNSSTSSPLERWKLTRDEIHQEICDRGYDRERRTFTQYYGSSELDASVLNIPLVGFLPGTDERVTGTIDAIARELGRDGFVSRYSTSATDDGLTGDEGQFLACSFWLVSALAANGRTSEARTLFERLLTLANDLGLLAEEYDVGRQRQVGNFLRPSATSRSCWRRRRSRPPRLARRRRPAPPRYRERTVRIPAPRVAPSPPGAHHRPVRITVRDSTPSTGCRWHAHHHAADDHGADLQATLASAAKGTTIAATVAGR